MPKRIRTIGVHVLMLFPAALAHSASGPASPARPNVIMITMDTVRSDHLGCYGYERPTSPNIDAFTGNATKYTHALAAAPWTAPTHASLFTALFPFEHGTRTYAEPDRNVVPPLDESYMTLAEAFAAEGYRTGAFVANAGWLNVKMKMNQGFDTYHAHNAYADRVNDKTFAWLAERGERPFFLFINYIDAHRPYNATRPAPFLDEPAGTDERGCVKALYDAVMPGVGDVPGDLVQCMIDQYDTGVWNLDLEVGRLIKELKELKLFANTMIVLTSDHGEFFGEHHLVEHSKDVYEPVIRIPLVIKNPGQQRGAVVDDLVTSTDVAGLVLARCGDMTATYGDVFHDLPGNHEVIVENYYSRRHDRLNPRWGHRFERVRTAIYDWPYKYIRSSDGNNELYRLDEDAAESNNLIASQPDVARRLAERLETFQNHRKAYQGDVRDPGLDEEQLKQLKALGYVDD
jgi:arylsulfatase A-like enzyme